MDAEPNNDNPQIAARNTDQFTPAKLNELRESSWLVYGIERFFYYIQYLSICNIFFQTRSQWSRQSKTKEEFRRNTKLRGNKTDIYISSWWLIEFIGFTTTSTASHCTTILIQILIYYRLFDITQAAVNMNIFDPIRIPQKGQYVSSATRSLVLGCLQYIEIILCFGIIYAIHIHSICHAESKWDAIYFSTTTQLTIGYGDLAPEHWMRGCVTLQGLIGFYFGWIVLSRFIAFIPSVRSVFGDDDKTGGNS